LGGEEQQSGTTTGRATWSSLGRGVDMELPLVGRRLCLLACGLLSWETPTHSSTRSLVGLDSRRSSDVVIRGHSPLATQLTLLYTNVPRQPSACSRKKRVALQKLSHAKSLYCYTCQRAIPPSAYDQGFDILHAFCGTLAVLGRSEKACTKPSANPAADPTKPTCASSRTLGHASFERE